MRSRGSAGDAFAGGDKSAPLYLAALDGGSDGVPPPPGGDSAFLWKGET